MALTFDQLVSLLTPQDGTLRAAGSAFGTPAVATLFGAYFSGGTLVLTGAASTADEDTQTVTVSGTVSPGTLLGLTQATVDSGVFTLLDDGTVTAVLPVPVGDEGWTPSASFPTLAGSVLDSATWEDATFTLDSTSSSALPADFRAGFGYDDDVDLVAQGMVAGLSLAGTATFTGAVGTILDLMFASPIPMQGPIATFFQAADTDDDDDGDDGDDDGTDDGNGGGDDSGDSGDSDDDDVGAGADEDGSDGGGDGGASGDSGEAAALLAYPQLLMEPTSSVGQTVALGDYSFTFDFSLGALLQEFPDSDGTSVGVFPVGAVKVDSTFAAGDVSVPVTLLIYQDGVLTFNAFGSPGDTVPTDGLPALLNGAPVADLFDLDQYGFPDFDAVTLNDVSVTLATDPSFALEAIGLGVTIGADQDWKLFDGFIVIDGIGFLLSASDSGGAGWTASGAVFASATLAGNAGVTLSAYVTLPDVQFEVELAESATLDLGDAVSGLLGENTPPLPSFTGGTFRLNGSIADSTYTFTADIQESWTIVEGLTLGDISLVLTSAPSGTTGSVYGSLTLGGVELYVSAIYDGTGAWTFSGGTGSGQTVSLTDLFADLGSIFGIELPAGLPEIDLTRLDIEYDTGTGELDLSAAVSIPGATVDLTALPLVGDYLGDADSLTLSSIGLTVAYVPRTPASIAMTLEVAVGTLTTSSVAIQLAGGDASDSSGASGSGGGGTDDAPAAVETVDDADPTTTLGATGETVDSTDSSDTGGPDDSGDADSGSSQVTYPTEGSGAWIDVQQSFGPVVVQKVGFTLDSSGVGVQINATLSLSAITMEVLGLGIGIPLKGGAPTFFINGLNVSYSAGPVSFDGGLLKVANPDYLQFDGELVIRAESFSLTAFGSYATSDPPSFFVFGMVNDVPIGGPPFFFVTGFSGGFGFNRSLLLPSIDQVASYPLVAGANSATSPFGSNPSLNDFLGQMDRYMGVSIGQDWIAAGVDFTTFDILQSYALLTLTFGTRVQVALLGLSTLTVPPQDPNPVAQAQLALEAVFAPDEGTFQLSGELTPSSYVLSTDCHLTGGFAWYMWFSPSDFAGDFVATLGGYNPYYSVPAHYPTVPRLGFNWQLSGAPLTIKGGMYLALTPHVFMVGGSLEAVWKTGGIKAWFDVSADFLVTWKPFHYDARMGVSFGVEARVDLYLVTVTVKATVGATLHLWGPDFSGVARIDLDVVSFKISFGSQPSSPPPIGWSEFKTSFLGASAPPSPGALAAASSQAPVLQLFVPTGLLRDLTSQGAAVQYVVDPQCVTFSAQTQIPAKTLALNGATVTAATTGESGPWPQGFGVGPMAVDAADFSSDQTVTITKDGEAYGELAAGAILGSAPKGMWLAEGSLNSTLNDASQVSGVVVGVSLVPMPPTQDQSLPVDVQILLYEAEDTLPWTWGTNAGPSSDPYGGLDGYAELTATVADAAVAAARASIVADLMANGFLVDNLIDTTALTDRDTLGLLDPPVLNLLGENPALAGE